MLFCSLILMIPLSLSFPPSHLLPSSHDGVEVFLEGHIHNPTPFIRDLPKIMANYDYEAQRRGCKNNQLLKGEFNSTVYGHVPLPLTPPSLPPSFPTPSLPHTHTNSLLRSRIISFFVGIEVNSSIWNSISTASREYSLDNFVSIPECVNALKSKNDTVSTNFIYSTIPGEFT